MHFGRKDLATEREHERALLDCLRHHESEVTKLYLLGDIFDQYIEYKHLVPKGFIRFMGLLAEWTDRGVPITYLTGNHDPWHQDYFERELGVRLVRQGFAEPLLDRHVYMNHGDIIASRFPMYSWIKGVLQHPIPVNLYRALLPGDAGFRLANWVNRRLHTDVIDHEVVEKLRNHAHELLKHESYDVVIMGHSHCAERVVFPTGAYINTGCWRLQRTFACMREDSLDLFQWDDGCAEARPFSLEALPT